MVKVSLIGVGRLGSQISFNILSNPKIDELVLIDKIKSLSEGIHLDLSHAYPEFAYKLKVGDYEDTENSKIIIISAGVARLQESRMELLDINKKIMKEVIENSKISDETILIIISNPLDIMTYLAQKFSEIAPERVLGAGNGVDSERLRFILSQKTNVKPDKIKAIVIGEHGENMIPVFSNCLIDGKYVDEYKLNLEEISKEVRDSAKIVIGLAGATQFGPAKNIEKLVNTILYDKNETIPVSTFVENNIFYGIGNVCIGLPCKIGIDGISEIVKINLNEMEKEKLKETAEILKKIQTETYEGLRKNGN